MQKEEQPVAGSGGSSVQKKLLDTSSRSTSSRSLLKRIAGSLVVHDQGSRRKSRHANVREDNQRKDNQRQMRQKTKSNKNNGNNGKKDIDPKRPTVLGEQGKVLKDKKTIEENNIEAGATIEMSLRVMGGMEKEELMETSAK